MKIVAYQKNQVFIKECKFKPPKDLMINPGASKLNSVVKSWFLPGPA